MQEEESRHHHNLSDDERVRVAVQADYLLEVLAKRYGIDASEVMDSLRWIREHREFVSQLKRGGLLSIISLLVAAAAMSLWEGIKSVAHK